MEDPPDFISAPWDKMPFAAIDFVRSTLNRMFKEKS